MTKSERAANWQKNIQGAWHGIPSVFDADGNHMGHIKVSRSSVDRKGVTTYYMDTAVDVRGPLRARLEAADFAFGVGDVDGNRVYLGPDFVGAGHPYGSLVDAHYYSPGWMADLRTMVHIIDRGAAGQLQVYSSLLYEGPTLLAVFNGLYRMANDYGINPDTTGAIDRFIASEREAGSRPHVLPLKQAGRWTGELAVHDPSGAATGSAAVSVDYRPTSLLAADVELRISGAVELSARYHRSRHGNRHTFDGPELYGNAIGYGRALYTSQHLYGQARKIRGRNFILDDDHGLSACWQLFESDRLTHTLYGCLSWQPTEQVLTARY